MDLGLHSSPFLFPDLDSKHLEAYWLEGKPTLNKARLLLRYQCITLFGQGWALENVVVPMARSYGLGEEYEYLRPSIKRFPNGREQVRLAKEAGFFKAVHYEIGFNLMGVLVATK